MKLRSKLILLVAGAAALFLASVALYFLIVGPVALLRSETGTFTEMSRATSALQAETNRLVTNRLGPQMETYQKARQRFTAAQEAVKATVYLPKASPELAAAVQAVGNLGELSGTGLDEIESSLKELEEACGTAVSFKGADFQSLVRIAAQGELKDSGMISFVLGNLVRKLESLNESLNVTRQVVDQKDGEINKAIQAIEAAASTLGLLGILLAVAGGIVVSLLVSRNITRALGSLSGTVQRVGSGDLRVRFQSRRKDELGQLGRNIDGFLDSLTASFRRIQAASAENLAVKDQLVQSVASATSSAVEIEANSSSILAQLRKVDERIQASESDLNGVVILLEAFHVRLGAQNDGVGDASRAVGELAQGVGRISELSNENRQAVEALLAESDRGREVFDRSFAKVAEINDSVSAIQDLVGAIAEIAGQTNILALNAAIEAAHAGEAGKGFAVVADEISKLAAASAASSAQIAVTIRDVVAKIREAGATREETLSAFDAIGTQIGTVSNRSQSIDAEASAMNQGTHRIREVMNGLASSSEDTTREADRIGNVATKLGDALGQVGRISHEVVSNIGEISSGLAEISRTVSEVSAQADRLGRVGAELDQAVNAFQTEDEPAAE